MSLMFLLPIFALVAFLFGIFLWSSRGSRNPPLPSVQTADMDPSGQRHSGYYPQIRQALDPRDLKYLSSAGGAGLARRVHRERRRVVKRYLVALRNDFDRLLRLARAVAVLSPEIVAVQELERLRLIMEFRWRIRVIQLRLLIGAATLPQISGLSDLVGHLAARLETAMTELGERAALAVELASSLDRRNMNTV